MVRCTPDPPCAPRQSCPLLTPPSLTRQGASFLLRNLLLGVLSRPFSPHGTAGGGQLIIASRGWSPLPSLLHPSPPALSTLLLYPIRHHTALFPTPSIIWYTARVAPSTPAAFFESFLNCHLDVFGRLGNVRCAITAIIRRPIVIRLPTSCDEGCLRPAPPKEQYHTEMSS